MRFGTAETSDNGLNGAQQLNGALVVERFELTKNDSAERPGKSGSSDSVKSCIEHGAESKEIGKNLVKQIMDHTIVTMRAALCLFFALLYALCSLVEAQQSRKISRIGFISPASSSTAGPNLEALRQGLRDLGYVDGDNMMIEARWAEGSADRLSHLIADLDRLKVDVIVVGSAAGAIAAKKSPTKIPVVFAAATDPLGHGVIDSLSHPGGNITGVSLNVGEGFSGKWIELLQDATPKVTRIAVLRNPKHPLSRVFHSEMQAAARALRLSLMFFEAQNPDQLTSALSRTQSDPAGAFALTPDPLFSSQRSRIVDFVTLRRLPAMFFSKEFVDIGGLMSYGPSFPDSYRRASVYVDKILKGAKPAELPVEQPTKFEFIINLQSAKQIGLTIPPNVLARADRVIR